MYKAVPSTMQMQAADCGAASLKMILDYYGSFYTLEEVRELIGVGTDGSTIGDIRRAASTLGLLMEANQLTLDELHSSSVPCILWWDHVHFVVYEGNLHHLEIINDPAIGRRRLSTQEFMAAWTGVAITIEDTKQLKPYRSPALIRSTDILSFLVGQSRPLIATGLFFNVLGIAPTIILAQLTSYFTDQVLIHSELVLAKSLLWSFFALTGVSALLTSCSYYLTNKIAYTLSINRATYFFEYIASLPQSWQKSRNPQELASRVLLPSQMVTTLSYSFLASIASILKACIVLVFVFSINIYLGFLFSSVVLCVLLINIFIERITDDSNQSLSVENGKQQSTALGTLSNLEKIRSSGGETDQYATWAGYYTNYINASQKVSQNQSFSYLASFSGTYLFSTILIIAGPFLIIKNQLSIGDFIGLQFLAGFLSSGVSAIPTALTQYQMVSSPLTRLRDAFESFPSSKDLNQKDAVSKLPSRPFWGSNQFIQDSISDQFEAISTVELRDVTISAGDNTKSPAYTLTLDCSKLTCLFSTDAKKFSSFIKISAGLNRPVSGSVVVSRGQAINDIVLGDVQYISADPILFDLDVRSNITLMNPKLSVTDIVSTLKETGLFNYIKLFPKGIYATLPGHGVGLSNTNKSRIICSRILLSAPNYLALDSFVDQLSYDSCKQLLDSLRVRGKGGLFVCTNLDYHSLFDHVITI